MSPEQRFVGNPDSDSRYVVEYDGCHNIPSYIENFTLILVTNMHCADILIVIHSPTDSITCPYVTITRRLPCVCVCDTQGLRDRQDRCVELCEARVSLRVCVCLDKTANPQATRTQYPVSQILISCLSVARRGKKKRRIEGGRGIRCPRNRRYGSPV